MSKKTPFSHRSIIVLAVVFLVLGAIALIDSPARQEKINQPSLLLPGFKTETVGEINLSQGDTEIVLQNKDDHWQVISSNNYPASVSAVEELLEDIVKAKIDSPASLNQQNYQTFGVTAEAADHLVLKDKNNKLLADFFVGKSGPGFGSYYLKKADNETVWLVKSNLNNLINKDSSAWKDKKIITVDPASLVGLNISYQTSLEKVKDQIFKQEISLKKDNDDWFLNDQPADDDKVKNLIFTVTGLNTLDFIDNQKPADFGLLSPEIITKKPEETSVMQVTLQKNDQSKTVLYFGQKPDEADFYYVRVEGNSTIFKITKIQAEELKVKPEEYKKQPSKQ